MLIALIDPRHIAHDLASRWFDSARQNGWATCPITENGLVRIISQPRYPNALSSPAEAVSLLAELRQLPNHQFWPDSLTLTDSSRIEAARLHTPAQITDSYLLALAAERGGQLATLDRRMTSEAVTKGGNALLLIG